MLTALMGGELTLRSQSGVGSTFGVRLYLREIAPPEVVVTPALQPTRSISGYVGSQRTLLVVDDQAVQRQLLAGLLIPLGFIAAVACGLALPLRDSEASERQAAQQRAQRIGRLALWATAGLCLYLLTRAIWPDW